LKEIVDLHMKTMERSSRINNWSSCLCFDCKMFYETGVNINAAWYPVYFPVANWYQKCYKLINGKFNKIFKVHTNSWKSIVL